MEYIMLTISAITLIIALVVALQVNKNKNEINNIKEQNEFLLEKATQLFAESENLNRSLSSDLASKIDEEIARIEKLASEVESQKYQLIVASNNISSLIESFNGMLAMQSTHNANISSEIGLLKGGMDGMRQQTALQIDRMQVATDDKLASFEILQKNSIAHLTENIRVSIERLADLQTQTMTGVKESTSQRLSSMDEKIISLSQTLGEKIYSLSQTLGENIKLLTQRTSENIAKLESSLSLSVQGLKANVDENLKYMNKENQKELERMRIIVDEKLTSTLETRLNNSFNVINNSLEQVYKGLGDVQNLTKGVGDLKNVLQNVKTRGTWAEVQLDNLLSQMLTPNQYKKQVCVDKATQERVDFGIVLPGKDQEIIIPIDSKFPIEDYYRLISASEEGDTVKMAQASKKLEEAIKVQANSISQKYIKPPKTTDFAVMYLPLEGLYAEVLRKSSLIEMLQRDKRVVIAGPSTLGAILNSLQMGFRTLEIEKRSGEIYDLLAVFKKEFLTFNEILDKTQKKIGEASNQIELASRKTRTIGRKLRDITSENTDSIDIEKDVFKIKKGEEDE